MWWKLIVMAVAPGLAVVVVPSQAAGAPGTGQVMPIVPPAPAAPEAVTIQALNTTPEAFDGKRIVVSGWIVIGDEKRYIVAQKRNYTMFQMGATCLSIINGGGLDAQEARYNGKAVVLTGVFRADVNREHTVRLGLCGATAIDLNNEAVDGFIEIKKPRR